ncbi:serine/threonine-protein kinase Chk2-like [Macrobrachium nipponense]|uniref:serine/threonine-protein kinase Chk2-like n=1 Tax=Macrobrachium nipponense TaxID=159736 RepID=UPI0030C88C59
MMDPYPSSQASTQGFRETQEIPEVPLDLAEIDAAWGRLFSVRDSLSSYNLTNETYSFGRGNVDHRFDSRQFNEQFLSAISKTHFRISRERKSATEVFVVLEDLSCNGTFVNQQLVGRGKKKILQSNDEIALAHSTRKGNV